MASQISSLCQQNSIWVKAQVLISNILILKIPNLQNRIFDSHAPLPPLPLLWTPLTRTLHTSLEANNIRLVGPLCHIRGLWNRIWTESSGFHLHNDSIIKQLMGRSNSSYQQSCYRTSPNTWLRAWFLFLLLHSAKKEKTRYSGLSQTWGDLMHLFNTKIQNDNVSQHLPLTKGGRLNGHWTWKLHILIHPSYRKFLHFAIGKEDY